MNENLPIGILPELHPDVFPEVMVRSNDDWSGLARNLMDAGIFGASDVPDYVEDTRQVIFHGLTAWCTRHIKETDYISLGFMLKTVAELTNEFSLVSEDELPKQKYVLLLLCENSICCHVEPVASILEKICPGLIATAFDTLFRASLIANFVLLPQDTLEIFALMNWEGDSSVSDNEARQWLMEYHGEVNDDYLPSVIRKECGESVCFGSTTTLSLKRLIRLSQSRDRRIAAIAGQILKLKGRIQNAKAKRADHDLCGIESLLDAFRCIKPCTIFFNENRLVYDAVSDDYQTGMSADGTDFQGYACIPDEVLEIKRFFERLETLFDLIYAMGEMIELVTVQ